MGADFVIVGIVVSEIETYMVAHDTDAQNTDAPNIKALDTDALDTSPLDMIALNTDDHEMDALNIGQLV